MSKSRKPELVDHATALEIVKMYFDEWKYRHENFWKRLTQLAVITFFTSSMPITYRIFAGMTLPRISMMFFPICGIILAFASGLLCLAEYKRLEAVDNTIKHIIAEQFGKSCAKEERTAKKLWEKAINKKIGIWVPCTLTIMQLVLAGIMIWMIAANRI